MVLQKLFHISDIHIRHGDHKQSRYSEYNTVFDNLQASLKKQISTLDLKNDEFVIIVTGDIFHNKNVIGNYGLTLYKKFIQSLTSLGKTILFHGNHDRNQNEIDQPSLVSSTLDIPNLTILTHTQTFTIDDVGFSYLNIDDTLDSTTTSGRVTSLPSFPTVMNARHKVALFHGTFANVKLYNGTEVNDTQNPYPFSLIEGFDFALLGDIHLRQKGLYQSTLWGYSGSLIQQNFGEDIINHGYMIWDLPSKTVKEVNVYNPYGMVNLKTVNDIICIRKRGQYEPLNITSEYFPKHIDIKLYSDVDLSALADMLSTRNITFNIINKASPDDAQDISTPAESSLDIDTHIDKDTLLQHFSTYLSPAQNTILTNIISSYDNLLFDVSKYPDDLQDKCLKINKELTTLIANCQSTQSTSEIRRPFTIKYLEWSNLFCYEGAHWIDFEKAEYSTFLVTGKNGTGKSAIYDILTLAIWGELPNSKQTTESQLTCGIINYKFDTANTMIDVEINNQMYRITKTFNKKIDNHKLLLNKAHTTIQKYVDSGEIELYKSDNAAKIEIIKMFGTLDEFLTSSMVTQNMDFDILKMGHADVLSLIDQKFDIKYIYSLYELFKFAGKKYQDFKKIIDAKMEVYAKLSPQTPINTATLSQLEQDLKTLEAERNTLATEFDSILVNINDSNTRHILSTDYDTLIAQLPQTTIKSTSDYNKAITSLAEYKNILRGLSQQKIDNLVSQYTPSLNLTHISKPCEYTLIESEADALKKYANSEATLLPEYERRTVDQLYTLKRNLITSLTNTTQMIKEHNHNKPITVQQPKYTESSLLTQINEIHQMTLDILINFCNSNARATSPPHTTTNSYSYSDYTDAITNLSNLRQTVLILKEKLANIDTKFKTAHQKKSTLTQVNKPDHPIKISSTTAIKKYLQAINITNIQNSINEDTTVMEAFYRDLDTIEEHNKELRTLDAEHLMLTSNKDYAYSPTCEYCCQRPWVCRINQLASLISAKKDVIASLSTALYDNTPYDYMEIYNRLEANKQILEQYELHTTWLTYYIYKEQDDLLTKDINKLLASKDTLNKELQDAETSIKQLEGITTAFNASAFALFDKYNTIQSYNVYAEWKAKYDDLQTKQTEIQNQLHNISEYLTYIADVKPRKEKLKALQESYAKWETYDKNVKINAAYKSSALQLQIDTYVNAQEYIRLRALKPQIMRKMDLATSISETDAKIKLLINNITEQRTIAAYNSANQSKHDILKESLQYIDDTLNLMSIVTEQFIDYRKELYATKVLPKLTAIANKYIKTLCHNSTKMFELDALLTTYRDKDIHINWLIKNTINDDNRQQTISVKQASGFQQFAISFALRMGLFLNRTCHQLFIDEGFTACDKENLSIVPAFLRGLLKMFKSIVIVSHIDLIQDSIDNVAQIHYNTQNKSSAVHYGEQHIVVQRRRKAAQK
jgi:DNA repair exonuclease SbcCD ATPase subunit/DNA repair exonuclease SbcCD nuclease subunit